MAKAKPSFSSMDAEEHGSGGGGHGGGSGRWLVSYADFITLMMVVFMVLYSIAKVDSAKYEKLKASLQASSIGNPPAVHSSGGGGSGVGGGTGDGIGAGSTSALGTSASTEPTTPPPAIVPGEATPDAPVAEEPTPAGDPEPVQEPEPTPTPPPKPVDPLEGMKSGFQGTAAARAGSLTLTLQDRGLVVSILSSILFAEGSADLKPDAGPILDEVAAQLKATGESILVEGAPDKSVQEAPWDLASRRSSTVVGYLVSKHGLTPGRFAAIGYGKGAGMDGLVNVVVLRRAQ